MATLTQLESGLKAAYEAGNMEYARILAAEVVKARQDPANLIPDTPVPDTGAEQPQPTFVDTAIGAGEAALSLGTGATFGALGMLGGTLKGIAEQILSGQFGKADAENLVEKAAISGAQAFTYSPRTISGQEQTGAAANAIGQALPPLIPMIGAPGAAMAGAKLAAPAIMAKGSLATGQAQRAVTAAAAPMAGLAQSAKESIGIMPKAAQAPSVGAQSMGAAETAGATRRETVAQGVPVPFDLTKGEATREANQLAFEKEAIKSPVGAPLRQRAEEHNIKLLQNFDAVVDKTGAEMADVGPAATGKSVIDPLMAGYKAAKDQTRAAYEAADASPEALAKVDVTPIVDYLNSRPTGLGSTEIPTTAKKYAEILGIATRGENAALIPIESDIRTLHQLRREINNATGYEKPDIREAAIIKGLIDQQIGPVSGSLYKYADKLRTDQARKYENRAIVAQFLGNKRGTDDPKVPVDEVFRKAILSASPEEITFLRRVLVTSGEGGAQGWKELQGATAKHIIDRATSGLGKGADDTPIASAHKLNLAVNELDKNGRLDIILGKQQAQTVRDLNDIMQWVNTVPPGTLVNTSGTSGAIMAAIAEAGATGAAIGLPVPVISVFRALASKAKDNRIKAKIIRALNVKPEPQVKPKKGKL